MLRLSVSSRFEWKAPNPILNHYTNLHPSSSPTPTSTPTGSPSPLALALASHTYRFEWKALRGLTETPGVLKAVPQLLLSLHFSEPSRYDDYFEVLQGLKSLGFMPFYVARHPNAEYLQIQVGESRLWSSYEVGLGNVRV